MEEIETKPGTGNVRRYYIPTNPSRYSLVDYFYWCDHNRVLMLPSTQPEGRNTRYRLVPTTIEVYTNFMRKEGAPTVNMFPGVALILAFLWSLL
jgi:hypothetical protein